MNLIFLLSFHWGRIIVVDELRALGAFEVDLWSLGRWMLPRTNHHDGAVVLT